MKNFYNFINEGKNLGLLYHFTTLSEAISIVELDRLYSTQGNWSKGYKRNLKHNGQISLTRDKLLYKDKPKGVSFGVRFNFDANKLSNDFKISPVKFSTLWDESEEAVFTIGGWNNRPELKKHQIFNFKKYVVSIDIMPFDVYNSRVESYQISDYEKVGFDEAEDTTERFKPKKSLINKAKKWFEEKGYKVRIVSDNITKKTYLSDRELKDIINKDEKI